MQSDDIYKGNVLFFGNALHFLHPVSGQGLNLSIRDIGCLYDLLASSENKIKALRGADRLGVVATSNFSQSKMQSILAEFAKTRKSDHDRTIKVTHGFVKWFVSNDQLLSISRNIACICYNEINSQRKFYHE